MNVCMAQDLDNSFGAPGSGQVRSSSRRGKQAVVGETPYAQVLKSSVTPIADFKSGLTPA